MKTKYSDEDLLHSLPDYISNKITDTQLIKALENKISSDPAFKKEFKSISETLGLFEPDPMEFPSDVYFNNLSVRINESVSKELKPLSFLEKLGISWKIALPALAALIIFTFVFLYFKPFSNANNEIISDNNVTSEKSIETDKNKESKEILPHVNNVEQSVKEKNKSQLKSIDPVNLKKNKYPDRESKIFTGNQNNESQTLNQENLKSVYSKEDGPVTGSLKATASENIALADITNDNEDNSDKTEINTAEQEDDILISGDTDEDFLEEDIFELTPEEQSEIVEFLKQS